MNALQKRYERRAEALMEDTGFQHAIEDARTAWNEAQPAYVVRVGDTPGVIGMPTRLEDDLETNTLRFYQRANDHRTSPSRTDDVLKADALRLMNEAEEMHASWEWQHMVSDLARQFWPPEEFPIVGGAIHPAERFVARALFERDVRFINHIECFAQPELRVLWRADIGTYIPLPAGITAHDLRQAADRLAREAQQGASLNLAGHVRRLRDEGHSLQAIADRLGMTESTVRSILKPPD